MKKIYSLLIIVLMTFVLTVGFCVVAMGNTYYVATNGNDANPGTISQPWATPRHAATVVVGGDTIYIRGGVYYVEPIECLVAGTANARITFQAYPGEHVVLDGSQALDVNPDIFTITTGQYIDIKDMELRNAKRIGVNMWGGKNVRVTNCTIHGCYWGALYMGNGATAVTFTHNTVYNNIHVNKPRTAGSWPSAVSLLGSDCVVTNCLVYENWGEGIGFYGTNQYVADNILHDNYSVELYADNVANSIAERNFIYTTHNTNFYRTLYSTTGPAMGIQFANERGTPEPLLDNLIIRNNIICGGIFTLFYWNTSVGGGLKNIQVVNNTFVEGAGAMLRIENSSGHTNTVFANNIFLQTTSAAIANNWDIPSTLTGLSFHHNCWYGGIYPSRLIGSGDITASPLLANPGGQSATDYMLIAGSTCINAGVSVSGVIEDYFRTARGSSPDIGAHEYNGIIPTPSPTPTLSPGISPTPSVTSTPTPSATVTTSPSGSNLALNKTATADSSEWWSSPAQGNDGNTSTRWSAGDGGIHWWKVDLGASYGLTGTEIMFNDGGSIYKYKIEVSTDNTNWILAMDMSGNLEAKQTHTAGFNATARYVRITGTTGSAWLSFWEFRVFGGGVSATSTSSVTSTPTSTASPTASPSASPTVSATSTSSVASATPSVAITPTASATPTATPVSSSGVNLAVNKTATADMTAYGGSAAYANDGNNSTNWDAGDNNFPHWWRVDLGASYSISRTEVMWTETNSAYKYKIEVSSDGSNWTVKVDKTANTTRTQTNIDTFTATARYVRITVTGSSDWYAGAKINEFRVY